MRDCPRCGGPMTEEIGQDDTVGYPKLEAVMVCLTRGCEFDPRSAILTAAEARELVQRYRASRPTDGAAA